MNRPTSWLLFGGGGCLIGLGLLLLPHCEDKPLPGPPAQVILPPSTATKWEYKILVTNAPTHEKIGANALATNEIQVDENKLKAAGDEGWELATSWMEPETAFPNFGKDPYVTGLQSNVRPMRVVLIFKRPAK